MQQPEPIQNVEAPPAALPEIHEPVLETQEEQDRFWKELQTAREQERIQAMADGKMDNPDVRKRLEDAITIVGTCPDMCPRFERYRRERQNDLDKLERIPGTKRVDHPRAVKKYERAVGDKSIPSDLRPMPVLQKTLQYLFHDLLDREGMEKSHAFIRDRTRAVRSDIVIQHLRNAGTIECFDRCVRFHILAMHKLRNTEGFSVAMEEQMIMNVTQSLKEYYLDLRNTYQSPTELEMRLYHRLIHMRNAKELPDAIPKEIEEHPIFKSATEFRLLVQKKSTVSVKGSALILDDAALAMLGNLSEALQHEGNPVTTFLVACILERHFPDSIAKLATTFRLMQDMAAMRGSLSDADIIDGKFDAAQAHEFFVSADEEMRDFTHDDEDDYLSEDEPTQPQQPSTAPASQASVFGNVFAPPSQPAGNAFQTFQPQSAPQQSAFGSLVSRPNVFGTTFGAPAPANASVFGPTSVFGAPISAPAPAPTFALPGQAPSPPASFPFFNQPASAPAFSTPPGHPASQSPPRNGPPQSFFQPPHALNPQAPTFSPSFFPQQPQQPLPSPPSHPPSNGQQNLAVPPMQQPFGLTPSTAAAPPMSRHENLSNASNSSRVSATPSLKIDIPPTLSASSSTATIPADEVASPRAPPTLGRMNPVSLPSTPSFTAPPPTSSLLMSHLKGNLSANPATPFGPGTTSGPLSPLFASPPAASSTQQSFSSLFANSHTSPRPPLSAAPSQISLGLLNFASKDKGKSPEKGSSFSLPPFVPTPPASPPRVASPPRPTKSSEDKARLLQQALEYERHSSVLKSAFKIWVTKTTDKAAMYEEALRKSEAYREKTRLQRFMNGDTPDKKRRMEADMVSQSSVSEVGVSDLHKRKRARKRVSATYQPPINDEEIAQRFKENQKDRDRRWAKGSFLDTLQQHVQSKTRIDRLPSIWQILVSVNPESDATAIWVETKFKIPDSGDWETETVFAIPISKQLRRDVSHPGVIVFECTPAEGVYDEIERKFRMLDDCSRLREIVKGISSQRYYNISLIALCWTRDPSTYEAPDFFNMIHKYMEDGVFKSFAMLPVSSEDNDPDAKLRVALDRLELDVQGERVDELTARDVCDEFVPTISGFISEWVLSCMTRRGFNWRLYNSVVHISLIVLNDLLLRMAHLCKISEGDLVLLPSLEDEAFDDSKSAYDVIEEWCTSFPQDLSHILLDLESHRNLEQDFPAQIFLNHVLQLVQELFQQASNMEAYWVLIEDLSASLTESEESLQPWRIRLSQRLNTTSRRVPPKRRSDSSMDESDLSGFVSPESKRARLSTPSVAEDFSPSTSPMINGLTTVSPAQSSVSLPMSDTTEAASSSRPQVTAAMLRNLTKDLKKKYIRTA